MSDGRPVSQRWFETRLPDGDLMLMVPVAAVRIARSRIIPS